MEEVTFNAFKKRVTGHTGPTGRRKVRNSWGVYDYYKFYRKTKPKEAKYILTESQYFAIIRHVNKLLADELLTGMELQLPTRMGELQARKFETYVRFNKEGKMVTNRPIDWDRTLKLWYEDEKSYNNKLVLYREEKEIFRLKYSKAKAFYNNKSFYEFKFNKDLKLQLKSNIKEGRIDAPLLKVANLKKFYGR